MSESTGKIKSRKKKVTESESSSNLINNFINTSDEPATKKLKKTPSVEADPDDSLKFFKPIKPKVVKAISEPSTSSSNIATNFIDESKTQKAPPKPKKTPKRKKPKSQPDIKKLLTRQERMFHQVVNENCLQEGVDPEEMLIALAISKSLKDQQEPSTSSKFENPFVTPLGGVKSISAKLEKYGFKCKKNYSEYELQLIKDTKLSKVSKFQKFPTILTSTSNEKRNEMIRTKIDQVLEQNQSQESRNFGNASRHDYQVFSFFLQELHEPFKTVFDINCDSRDCDEVLLNYYVTDLFQPSLVKAGHLLKDWRAIPGREATPEREVLVGKKDEEKLEAEDDEEGEVFDPEEKKIEEREEEKNLEVIESESADEVAEILSEKVKSKTSEDESCLDIFADIGECSFEENQKSLIDDKPKEPHSGLADNIEKLLEKLSQSMNEKNLEAEDEIEIIEIFDEEIEPEIKTNEAFETILIDESSENESNDEILPKTEFKNQNFSLEHKNLSLGELEEMVLNQPEEAEPESDKKEEKSSLEELENSFLRQPEEPEPEDEKENSLKELENSFLKQPVEPEPENNKVDLTIESSSDSEITIPYDDSYFTLKNHLKNVLGVSEIPSLKSPTNIDLVSSDEEEKIESKTETVEDDDLGLIDEDQISSQNSSTIDDDDAVQISDEEINYSIKKFHNNNEDPSDEAIDLTQNFSEPDEVDLIEIDNRMEKSLVDVLDRQESFNIDDTISNLLEVSTMPKSNATKKDNSMKFFESNGLSDSLMEIMKKYGGVEEKKESPRSFKRMQSDSLLMSEKKRRKSVQFSFIDEENFVDLTQPLQVDEKENLQNFNSSIHMSMESLQSFSPAPRPRRTAVKRSLGVQIDDEFIVDTETFVPEPDFKNMTPVELKQELFKYGIRSLPVKKAIELLEFIYNQLHPKIRAVADEEIDVNDSRRVMNITDIATDIGVKEDDDFVFQPGLVENEEFVLPTMRKSKIPSCLIPLHISFYNMVRSSEKLQKFILEYRPVELEQLHKHFRKFGLSYQPNDLISFLDRRCITFKTKEKSYAKTHERKKQKRTQKTQKTQKSQK